MRGIYFLQHVRRYFYLHQLKHSARYPRKIQESLLLSILKKNADTEFGHKHNFGHIHSYADFVKHVPIHTHEDLRPYIEKQMNEHVTALTAEFPVMYAQTSGTLAKAKYIPILEQTIDSYKKAQEIFSYVEQRDVPGIFNGKILAIVSPAIEGYLDNGVPYGSMSGIVYKNMPGHVRSQYVLPPELFELTDYDSKYLLIAAFALVEENISVLASANPSTFLRLVEIINTQADKLIQFVASGDLSVLGVAIDSATATQLHPYCQANKQRAHYLEDILKQPERLLLSAIWPNIKALVTWTSGNCALLIPKLKKLLADETRIIEMGYLSSEFRGTITIDCLTNHGLPTIEDVFYEFVEVSAWDSGAQPVVTIEHIENGQHYYILVTAAHGLYRYFINDIVLVTGKYENTPTLSFVQKGKGVTNLTGEKLYENQVIQALQNVCSSHTIEPDFFIMLANEDSFSYTLYIEARGAALLAQSAMLLDEALGELNMEYLAKIKSARLKPVNLRCLRAGTFEAYKRFCMAAGQREGQFKVLKLQYRKDVSFPFDDYINA